MSGDELTPPDDGQPFDPYYTDVEPSAAAGGVWANRRVRNGLIAAGVVAAAVVVIGINDGNSGGAGSALRSQEPSAATTTTTIRDTDDDDEDDVVTVTRSLDDVTTPGGPVTYDELSEDEFTDDEFFDDEFTDDTLFDDGFFDDDEFADDDEFFDDFFSDDDDDFFGGDDDDFFRPSTGNRNRLAPRVPFVPRTTTTVAAATTTEPPEETTTTVADTTTTVADTTTTSSTTTTVPVPAPAWTPVTQGLTCSSNPLTLWARGNTVLAGSQDDELFALSGDQWSVATGIVAGRVRAVVARETEPNVRWVAGSAGVFRLDGTGEPDEIGDLSDVVSLALNPSDSSLLAVTSRVVGGVTTTELHRSNLAGSWDTVTPPLATGETLQALHVHDGDTDTAFLGTSLGVRESDDGGLTWEPVPNLPSGVVGDPVFAGGTLSWLRTGGQGVLQWTADPAGWTFDDDAGDAIPETTASLAVLANGHLLTVGAGKLVVSVDGAAWTDFGPALPASYPTAGVVRHGTATFVWASDCRTDVVLRLTDQPA